MQEFEYLKASSITDALDMFNKSNEPSYLAGGHTILPTMKQNLAAPSHLIDISSIPELKSITVDDKYVTIGAGTVHADVADSKAIQEAIDNGTIPK